MRFRFLVSREHKSPVTAEDTSTVPTLRQAKIDSVRRFLRYDLIDRTKPPASIKQDRKVPHDYSRLFTCSNVHDIVNLCSLMRAKLDALASRMQSCHAPTPSPRER